MRKPPLPDMDELLQRVLDDQIQPEEMKRLQQAMREDPRVRDYYIDSMLACAVIRRSSQVTGEFSESDLIQSLADHGSPGKFKRAARFLRSMAAILILGALIGSSLIFYRHKARGTTIGVLVNDYEAQWVGPHPRPGESLFVGPYDLREGVAKMELDRGTSLLLEAPCRMKLDSDGEMVLRSGRLTVAVSPQAKGFRVRTLTTLLTDLGTEFGVIVHPDGSTEAHVLQGHIRVALDPNKAGRSNSLVVREGQAVEVDASGQAIQSGLAAQSGLFLLQVPSGGRPSGATGRLNLADIVAGGNGQGTGILDQGIDLGTGRAFRHPATTIQRSRRNDFRPLPRFRGIDGIFVPNGALGPVVISSTGLRFSQCPDTQGSYFGGPANSGKFLDLPSQQIYTARLNGVPFGTSRHPALSLHPNAGITFDLDQIRQDNPAIQIDRFTALCGIPKNLPQPRFSAADVWVLLDGVVSLHLRYPMGDSVVETMDVPIRAQTRFLTLAATCTGHADYSWIILGDPFLGPAATK